MHAQPSAGVPGSKVNEAPRCMNEWKGGLWSDLTHPYTQGLGEKVQDRQGTRMQVISPSLGCGAGEASLKSTRTTQASFCQLFSRPRQLGALESSWQGKRLHLCQHTDEDWVEGP